MNTKGWQPATLPPFTTRIYMHSEGLNLQPHLPPIFMGEGTAFELELIGHNKNWPNEELKIPEYGDSFAQQEV
jgi:hypothetical protein